MSIEKTVKTIHAYPMLAGSDQHAALTALLRAAKVNPALLPCLHVAGTNGKGSVCAFAERILRESGFKTGLFTSPYLFRFEERIQILGRPVGVRVLQRHTQLLHEAALETGARISQFGFLTALAFSVFLEAGVEAAVLETGLGGRLDPTNICTPQVSVITPIGLDHTAILGSTLEAVAGEKAGIIKPGIPVITGGQPPQALEVIQTAARKAGARIYPVTEEEVTRFSTGLSGTSFQFEGETYETALAGVHQAGNAAVAIRAAALFAAGSGKKLAAKEGVAKAKWPCRLEWAARSPDVIIDGAHNPAGAQTALDFILRIKGDRPVVLLLGIMADKDYKEIAKILEQAASQVVLAAFQGPRPLFPQVLAGYISKPVHIVGDAASGVRQARELAGPRGIVLAAGSLYFAAEVKLAVEKKNML